VLTLRNGAGLDGDVLARHRVEQLVHGSRTLRPAGSETGQRPAPPARQRSLTAVRRRHGGVRARVRGSIAVIRRSTVGASRSGRSHEATTTISSASASRAVMTPTAGPSPGQRSATTRTVRASEQHRVAAHEHDGVTPGAGQRGGDPLDHRRAPQLDERLVGPHPPAGAAAQHRAGGHDAAGPPSGSSCTRNRAMRSARRPRRCGRPSRRGRRGRAGSRGSSARTSGRSPTRATRWRAACRARGGSRRGSTRSARCRRARRRPGPPTRRGSGASERRRRRRPPAVVPAEWRGRRPARRAASGSGGGRTVEGRPWDIVTGRWSLMSRRVRVAPPLRRRHAGAGDPRSSTVGRRGGDRVRDRS